jgi:hypothetical protein
MGTRLSDHHPAGTQAACGHPAQSVRLATGGKSDHVAGPARAWLTAASTALSALFPPPEAPLFSG